MLFSLGSFFFSLSSFSLYFPSCFSRMVSARINSHILACPFFLSNQIKKTEIIYGVWLHDYTIRRSKGSDRRIGDLIIFILFLFSFSSFILHFYISTFLRSSLSLFINISRDRSTHTFGHQQKRQKNR